MRVPFETIKEHGQRVTPHSKFYVYNDMVFEPVYRKGKICKNYKAVEKWWRIKKILGRGQKKIPKVSDIDPEFRAVETKKNNKKTKVNSRFEIMDL